MQLILVTAKNVRKHGIVQHNHQQEGYICQVLVLSPICGIDLLLYHQKEMHLDLVIRQNQEEQQLVVEIL